MKYLFRIKATPLLFGFLFFISHAVADYKSDLLARPTRPTFNEFLQALNPFPESNPFQPCVRDDFRLPLLYTTAPQLIVELEYAFPDNIWAPLGRDTAVVGDLLEAFYLSIGQTNRVVRLNASGPSFKREYDYLDLLISAGLVDHSGYPLSNFIILDPTRWAPESQSRMLISTVYKRLPVTQHQDFLTRVNAVALDNRGARIATRISPLLNIPAFFKSISMDQKGPKTILESFGSFSYLPSCNNEDIVWHGPFGQFTKIHPGLRVPLVGTPTSAALREHILWFMYEIYRAVNSDAFLNELNRYSQQVFHLEKKLRWNTPISRQIWTLTQLEFSDAEMEQKYTLLLKAIQGDRVQFLNASHELLDFFLKNESIRKKNRARVFHFYEKVSESISFDPFEQSIWDQILTVVDPSRYSSYLKAVQSEEDLMKLMNFIRIDITPEIQSEFESGLIRLLSLQLRPETIVTIYSALPQKSRMSVILLDLEINMNPSRALEILSFPFISQSDKDQLIENHIPELMKQFLNHDSVIQLIELHSSLNFRRSLQRKYEVLDQTLENPTLNKSKRWFFSVSSSKVTQ
jgi:hypothetical protein